METMKILWEINTYRVRINSQMLLFIVEIMDT